MKIPNKFEKHFEKSHPDRLFSHQSKSDNQDVQESGNVSIEVVEQETTENPEPEMPILNAQQNEAKNLNLEIPDPKMPELEKQKNPEPQKSGLENQELTSTPKKLPENPKSPEKSVKNISVEIETENKENFLMPGKSMVEIPKEVLEIPDEHQDTKPMDKSFMSDTSGLGSISVSGIQGNDGEVSTIWKCLFCKKKYLSREFVMNHIESQENGGHNISLEYFTKNRLEIKCVEI